MARSQGTGLPPWEFAKLGENVVFEHGVLVFHSENIYIGSDVYVGHYSILKGYFKNQMEIGEGSWIGQHCFMHSAGGIRIGKSVGIGPGAKILTSSHDLHQCANMAIMRRPLILSSVIIGDGCDIGINAVILPGVRLGQRVQVGAGAVVTHAFADDVVVAGVPAREVSRLP